MQNVLFLCTGNSCRSQMAEGFCRNLYSDKINSYSAGVEVHGINPLAVEVMQEVSVDISKQQSTLFKALSDIKFDVIITVCDNAANNCPYISSTVKIIHRQFDDPPFLAKNANSKSEKLVHYRKVRNDIADWIKQLPLQLEKI